MSFTESERRRFITVLQQEGWEFKDGVICSPSGGMWFEDSHFADCEPGEMKETFTQRAARIREAGFDATENRQVCEALNKVIN